MAGKHLDLATSERTRVRVPLFSNWAIEFLHHLELGNAPRLDHRARLTAVLSVPQGIRRRPVLTFSFRAVTVFVAPVLALIAWSASSAVSGKPSVQPTSAQTGAVCESIPHPNEKELDDLNWLNFGGVQTATYTQKCSDKTFRVVRKASGGKLLRVSEASKSG